MNNQSPRRVYQAPMSRNLSGRSVVGQDVGPMGVCSAGQFPWQGCSQGFSYGEPGNCDPVGGSPSLGNLCQVGTTPVGTTQCFPVGSAAGNTCGVGTWA